MTAQVNLMLYSLLSYLIITWAERYTAYVLCSVTQYRLHVDSSSTSDVYSDRVHILYQVTWCLLCVDMCYMFCVESYGTHYIEPYTFKWPVLYSIFQLIK
jgi:hypothetical protein